jgi:D-alanine--poly(phosphoribitol) ligase subunit 1
MDILACVRRWSKLIPERPAMVSGRQILTYRNLDQSSDALAAHLSVSLPDGHSPLAVIGHKEPEMLVAFLAAAKSGHPYIPIDTSLPQPRIDTIFERSQAALCLTPAQIRELLAGMTSSMPALPHRMIRPEDPWYIIFTSGSTGEPKGVVITCGCLVSFVKWMLHEQHLSERQEVFLNQAPFSFDLSVMDLYLSLATGGTLYSIANEEIADPRQLFISLAGSNISVWVSTPSFVKLCLSEPAFTIDMLSGLRKFLFCGEILPPEVAASLLQRFPAAEVWNTYGPTETTCATTSVHITQRILSHYRPLPVGYPKPDCRILVIKPDGTPAIEEESGEIVIAGPNVSPGYIGQPDLNDKAFFELEGQHAYRTGDQGYFHKSLLFFDGRQDDQIKLHGYRIELGDIEANLMALPSVLDAIVIPRLKDGQPNSLSAFVILRNATTLTKLELARMLKHELGQHLPAYMLPRKFYFLDKFPMTANGKIDRLRLAESLQ